MVRKILFFSLCMVLCVNMPLKAAEKDKAKEDCQKAIIRVLEEETELCQPFMRYLEKLETTQDEDIYMKYVLEFRRATTQISLLSLSGCPEDFRRVYREYQKAACDYAAAQLKLATMFEESSDSDLTEFWNELKGTVTKILCGVVGKMGSIADIHQKELGLYSQKKDAEYRKKANEEKIFNELLEKEDKLLLLTRKLGDLVEKYGIE